LSSVGKTPGLSFARLGGFAAALGAPFHDKRREHHVALGVAQHCGRDPVDAPEVEAADKRLVCKREVPAVTLLKLTDVAALPWHDQPERVFDGIPQRDREQPSWRLRQLGWIWQRTCFRSTASTPKERSSCEGS
jgi:hypothetical protein